MSSRGRRPVVAQEIGAALTIPPSSLSNLLGTLVEREYLSREGRLYKPGGGLARLRAQTNGVTLEEKIAPLVRSLRVQLNETTSFFLRRDWEVEAVFTETSDHALRYAVQVGSLVPMHAFSAGKAILAALPGQGPRALFRRNQAREVYRQNHRFGKGPARGDRVSAQNRHRTHARRI